MQYHQQSTEKTTGHALNNVGIAFAVQCSLRFSLIYLLCHRRMYTRESMHGQRDAPRPSHPHHAGKYRHLPEVVVQPGEGGGVAVGLQCEGLEQQGQGVQ